MSKTDYHILLTLTNPQWGIFMAISQISNALHLRVVRNGLQRW